jgi:tetratricopeptide (TPR) repeat protein
VIGEIDMAKAVVLPALLFLLVSVSWPQISAQVTSSPTKAKDGSETAFSKANSLYNAGRYSDAVKEYLQGLKSYPNDFNAYTSLGLSYINLRQPEAAIEVFKRAVSLRPKSALAHSNLSYGYLEAGRFDEALKAAQEAVELNPRYAIALNNLGYAHLRLGNYNESVNALKAAIEMDETYIKAYSNLGQAYFLLGRHEEAAEILKQAVRINPNEWEPHSVLGRTYMILERYENAAELLGEAIRIDPTKPTDHFGRGAALAQIGRYEEAVESFTQGLTLRPQETQAYRSRAYANLNLGRGKAAAADAQEFLKISGGQNKHFLYMKLVIYLGNLQAGNQAEASQALEEITARSDYSEWPIPVIQHLRREMSAQDLLSKADDGDKKTEANAYIGLNLSLSGKGAEAVTYLQWVKENGNRKFVEYSLTLSELNRLGKAK